MPNNIRHVFAPRLTPQSRGTDVSRNLSRTLALIRQALPRQARSVQSATCEGAKALFEKLGATGPRSDELEEALAELVKMLFAPDGATEAVRSKAADAVTAIAAHSQPGSRLQVVLAEEIQRARRGERAFSVQQRLDRARQLLGSTG